MIRRALVAITVALSLISLALLAPSSPADGGASLVHRPHSVKVPDQPEYSLTGVGVAVNQTGQFYAAVGAELARQEALRAATAAREARARAPQPASHAAPAPRGPVNWDGIAQCETGGNWQHQTQYDGGLGILHAAWIEFGGRDFAEYGSQATREQQIVVAERVYARYGLSGWGCRAYG